ncbi:hypothetical protein EPO34_03290 [Patescibacteria group bacterium]|nr:MAG: hypothetical protein EPO34_03290 [Patescibacteria group bacterium]
MATQASDLISGGLNKAAGTAGFGTVAASAPSNLGVLIGKLLSAVLGILGLALVVLLIYGGILYLTAAGNEENVKKAKRTIMNAVIGIVIVASSYALASFVVSQLQRAGREEIELTSQELAEICALDPTSSACPQGAGTSGSGTSGGGGTPCPPGQTFVNGACSF